MTENHFNEKNIRLSNQDEVFQFLQKPAAALSGQLLRQPLKSFSAEPDMPKEKLEQLDSHEKSWHAQIQEYHRRWQPIQESSGKLTSHFWEAEAIWIADDTGKAIAAKNVELNKLLGRLFFAVQETLQMKDPAQRHVEPESPEDSQLRMRTVFAVGKNDAFGNEINVLIENLESELHSIIKRHRS